MEAMLPKLFLAQHGHIHAGKPPAEPHLEDRIVAGLSDAQMRECLPDHNSVAWLLWYLARGEDLMVNTAVRGAPEVFDRGGWQARLGVARRDMGVGWSMDEVADFSAHVDLAALRAYRAAVAEETRSGLSAADLEGFEELIPGAGERARISGDIAPGQEWVYNLLDSRPRWWFLGFEVIGHAYMHLADAQHVAGLLRG